jgi:hypothetical protein
MDALERDNKIGTVWTLWRKEEKYFCSSLPSNRTTILRSSSLDFFCLALNFTFQKKEKKSE